MTARDSSILDEILRRVVECAHPDKVILFGSRARDTAEPGSDWDLLVVKSGVKHRRQLAQEIYRALFGVPASVDVMVFTPEDVEAERDCPWSVISAALSHGRVVHGG
jgi:predicted nucleotidyltransferase